MFSKLSNNLTAYSRAFSLPKPDLNGVCDGFKAPKFMEDSSSECLRVFDV